MTIKILPKTSLTFLPADDQPDLPPLPHDLWIESQTRQIATKSLVGCAVGSDLYTGTDKLLGVFVVEDSAAANPMVRFDEDYELFPDQALTLGENLISAAMSIQNRRAAS